MHTVLVVALSMAASFSPSKDCDVAAGAILTKLQAATARQNKADKSGNVEEEITALREVIDSDTEMSKHCPKSGKYELYLSAFGRTKLAILLAGQKQLAQAESMFRMASADYKNSGVAGNDTYSNNDLPFAYTLRREGKAKVSSQICDHWKNKVAKIGKEAVVVARNSDPQPPPYDTPEQQIGRWNLFCANENDGIAMLNVQIGQHPEMLAPVSTLGEYYTLNGDFRKAQELENTWHDRMIAH
jgi:hypothetical protein